MGQTSVTSRMAVGIVGQIANLQGMKDAVVNTARNAEASAEIGFGLMVIRDGTNADTAKLLNTSAAAMVAAPLMIGVSTFGHSFAEPQELGDTDAGGFKPGTTFGVLFEGPIWVLPEEAVTPSSDVRVRAVAAGGEKAGAFRTSADATDCVDITPLARWVTAGSSTVPAILFVNMVSVALATADA